METLQRFSSDGAALFYHDSGTGQPLVLVHAFPLHSAMWHPQIAALNDHYRIIAPDLRGFGASELGQAPTSLAPYADDLAALLDHLGLDQVVLGGLSMGGYIALEFVRRHATRLTGLILADTRAGADSEDGKRGRETNARLAESNGAMAVGETMLPRLVAAHAPDVLRAEIRTIIAENTSAAGTAAALRSMAARPDSTDLLTTITIPTLIIVGSEDLLTPPAEAHRLHAGIAGSQLIEIPNVGHLSNLEAPAAFNAAVQAFLDSARG